MTGPRRGGLPPFPPDLEDKVQAILSDPFPLRERAALLALREQTLTQEEAALSAKETELAAREAALAAFTTCTPAPDSVPEPAEESGPLLFALGLVFVFGIPLALGIALWATRP